MLHLRMTRDETITLLRRYADDIRGFAVTGLYLFGSTARGEAGPASDVDLFIDYNSEEFDFVKLFGVERPTYSLTASQISVW